MPYAVAVDIGGTFTDLVAYDRDGHRVAYAKSRPPITISSPESSTGSTR
jgi:N-methylhydantoinase A/oxoprolinase/acetone carboxylase beta subunit